LEGYLTDADKLSTDDRQVGKGDILRTEVQLAAEVPPSSPDASQEAQRPDPEPDRPPERPWRTEGLPKGRPPSPRRWWTIAMWFVGYLLLFGVLTLQDRLSGPAPIPYSAFKTQVANKNSLSFSREEIRSRASREKQYRFWAKRIERISSSRPSGRPSPPTTS
jgi:hypothetical protein